MFTISNKNTKYEMAGYLALSTPNELARLSVDEIDIIIDKFSYEEISTKPVFLDLTVLIGQRFDGFTIQQHRADGLEYIAKRKGLKQARVSPKTYEGIQWIEYSSL